jgi:hypothetical protein
MNLFEHLVGLLGLGISSTQGHYLHRTTQHRKTRTHIHAPSGIGTRDPSVRAVEDNTCLNKCFQFSSGCSFSLRTLQKPKKLKYEGKGKSKREVVTVHNVVLCNKDVSYT